MIPCYIFDIDGTLANGDHRLHWIKPEMIAYDPMSPNAVKPNWDRYFDACDKDTPHPHIVDLARDLYGSGNNIVFVTGRSESCREKTEAWLRLHLWPIYSGELFMRPLGDHKPDHLLKIELLAKVRADGYEPIMAFDDRNAVVKAWREAGIPCAQVAEGDF